MNVPGILIGLSILFCAMDVQAQTYSPVQLQDSISVLVGDSTLLQVSDSIPEGAVHAKDGVAAQDTIPTKKSKPLIEVTSDKFFAPSYMFSPSPKKAVLYSAIFPGLGQIYNRKYWKLPIVYGFFVGLTYAITWNNGYYQDYLGAYQDMMDGNPETNRWHNMLPYGQNPETVDRQWFTNVLQQRKDHFRYYRDFSIIGTVAVYLIAVIDAYVDAQLFDFDMSPDLSMRMTPVVIGGERGYKSGSSSYGMQLSFNF